MNKQEVLGLVVRYGTIVNSKFILSRIGINAWSLDFTTDSGGRFCWVNVNSTQIIIQIAMKYG